MVPKADSGTFLLLFLLVLSITEPLRPGRGGGVRGAGCGHGACGAARAWAAARLRGCGPDQHDASGLRWSGAASRSPAGGRGAALKASREIRAALRRAERRARRVLLLPCLRPSVGAPCVGWHGTACGSPEPPLAVIEEKKPCCISVLTASCPRFCVCFFGGSGAATGFSW